MKYLNLTNVAILLLFSLQHLATGSFSEEDLLVDAGELGLIKGIETSTIGSPKRPYISFRGLKYAQPPIRELRYSPSVRATGRLNTTEGGIFNASAAGPMCSQAKQPLLPDYQSEDCLTVNVDTPKPYNGSDAGLLPVIFYIHGGAFTVGEGSSYNGDRLLDRDVVLVSCNYRLGVLGFFSLNTEDVPGNAAMYDIINALKWTKEFIKYFNGDPNRITIAGQSAGSVAVTHLLTSPVTRDKDLFHGAIGASGTALAAWGTTENPLRASLRIAELSGCYDPAHDYQTVIANITSCMKNVVTSDHLVQALFNFQVEERRQSRLGFDPVSPTLQTFEASADFQKILTEHPRAVFESGRQANVPLMMGATRHDGSYVLGVYYNRFLKDNGHVNTTDSDREFMKNEAVPKILETLGIPNEYGVYDSIAKVYLGDSRKSGNFWEMYPGFIDLFSVFFFKASSYQTALYHSNLNDTFWYSFDYQGTITMFPLLFGTEPVPFKGGITHGDDMIYVFNAFFPLNQEDKIVSDNLLDYWSNFATFGNPTPDTSLWHRLTVDESKFLSIGKESVELQHYDDVWSDIGWEVLPGGTSPTTTTTTTTEPSTNDPTESKTPTTTKATPPPGNGAREMFSSCQYLIVVVLSINLFFTLNAKQTR